MMTRRSLHSLDGMSFLSRQGVNNLNKIQNPNTSKQAWSCICALQKPTSKRRANRRFSSSTGTAPFFDLFSRDADFAVGLFHSHPCLRKLSLFRPDLNTIDALPSVVRSGVQIEMLALQLDGEQLQYLVLALGSCRTLSHLAVESSLRNYTGVSEFAHYVASSPSIRHLSLRNREYGARGIALGIAAYALRAAELPVACCRIGSPLQVLDVDCYQIDNIQQVLMLVTKRECRLSSLTLSRLSETAWLQVIQCLPLFLRLRELKLACCYNIEHHGDAFYAPCAKMVVCIKYPSLGFAKHETCPGVRKENCSALKDNQYAVIPMPAGYNCVAIEIALCNDCSRTLARPALVQATRFRRLYSPCFLRSVEQAPRAAATVLAGLLTYNHSLGPHRQGKRKCHGAEMKGQS
jgi:hypothetical protein